ncbi:DUF2754 family protein, partial [Salmonella enterica subsp. enterica serovar Enteritidis]|nr:DUF2754 family protein [Salmonella enterica subsp. enterica serovar Enteritidis]
NREGIVVPVTTNFYRQTYGVGLVTWIISFWLAGFIIRRREDDEVKDAR